MADNQSSSSSDADEDSDTSEQQAHFLRLGIEQYQTELVRNPQNTNASSRLRDLRGELTKMLFPDSTSPK
jgi:hypothetical protein